MREVLLFYTLCCSGNLLFHFVSAFISSDLKELMFGFPIALIFVCLLYSPLCTFLAYIYKRLKINAQIIKHPLLYSLSPFVITSFITKLSDVDTTFRDYLLCILFVSENILIIVLFGYQRIFGNHVDDYYYDANGEKQDISRKGEGTTKEFFNGDISVVISGKSYEGLVDKDGNKISDGPEYILAHEIAGHAEPRLNDDGNGKVINSVEIENTIRRETNEKERKEEPGHDQ